MAFCTSFFRPRGLFLCRYQCVIQTVKDEIAPLKFINFKGRHYLSSVVRNYSRRKVKNSKNSEKLDSESNPDGVTPFSMQLLVKPFLFTLAFSSASIAGSAIWQYENLRQKTMTLIRKDWLRNKFNLFGNKKSSWRSEASRLWNQLNESEKFFFPICFINVLIFLAWKVPRFHPVLIKYFCNSPFSGAVCWPMVLSTFSHYSFIHLVANMMVLHSLSQEGIYTLGKEQFFGFYLAGGVISSFFSHLYKIIIRSQAFSMGASGSVMAILAYHCVKNPDSKLIIIFLPWITIPAELGFKLLMGLDIAGLVLCWNILDHAAHLGGALFGLGWCYWGNPYIWQRREPFLQWWQEIRSTFK